MYSPPLALPTVRFNNNSSKLLLGQRRFSSRIRKFIRVIRNGDVFSGWKQGRFFFSRGKHCRDSRRSAGRKIRLENFLPRHVTLQVRVKRWKFQEKKKKKKVNQSNSYRRRKIPELSVNCWYCPIERYFGTKETNYFV